MNDAEIARQLLQLAKNATEHAFVLIDLDGLVRWWSPGATKLFSIHAAAAVGMPFREIFTDEDQRLSIDQLEIAIARAEAVSEDDRWHQRADGSRFWSTGALEPIEDESGAVIGYGKILRDRTNLAEQFAFLHARIEQNSQVANDYAVTIAKMSHEIRNTLTAIAGGISQLERPVVEDQKRQRIAELMRSQLEVLTRLGEDLLVAAQERTSRVLATSASLVLQDLMQEIIENSTQQLVHRRLSLLAPTTPIRVEGDRTRLLQAFGNIVDNAIKYTPTDGRIWVKITVESHEAVVHVEDNGRGVPPDMMDKIFELFTRAEPRGPVGGLGVGLAIVHEVVTSHGGCVQVRSEGHDRGSIFTVRLPLLAAE